MLSTHLATPIVFKSSGPMATVFLSGGAIIDIDALILIQLVIFFLAFFFLRSLVFKPVMAVIDEREHKIEGVKAEALKMAESADTQMKVFDKQIQDAKIQGQKEKEKLVEEARQFEHNLMQKSKDEYDAVMEQAKKTLNSEVGAAKEALTASVPMLANHIAEKVLGRSVS